MTTTSKTGLTDKFRRPATKVCRLCEKELPIKDFNLSIKGRFGYTNECRACRKEHEDRKVRKRKEHAITFFDAKFFTLLIFLSAPLTTFSQNIDSTTKLRQFNRPDNPTNSDFGGYTTGRAISMSDFIIKPDTVRAICLVTLFENGIAHARMGFAVIETGKRPVYLDCRKRALKGSQMGWGFREVDVNYKQKVK